MPVPDMPDTDMPDTGAPRPKAPADGQENRSSILDSWYSSKTLAFYLLRTNGDRCALDLTTST